MKNDELAIMQTPPARHTHRPGHSTALRLKKFCRRLNPDASLPRILFKPGSRIGFCHVR
ncbi:MAG: hypothetical protein ACWA6Y_06345 [Polaromonas sp.]